MRPEPGHHPPWPGRPISVAATTVMRPASDAQVSPDQIACLLTRWQTSGLITADQAERIAAAESVTPVSGPSRPRPRTGSLIGEALGYTGGALIVAAVVLLMGRFWSDLSLGVRVIITGAAAVESWLFGRLISGRFGAAGHRLRSVLWALSVGMSGATAGLVGADGFHWAPNNVAVFAGAVAAGYATWLWWCSRSVLLHAATFAALTLTVGAAADHLDVLHEQAAGLGIWLLAISWLLAARAGIIAPRQLGSLLGAFVAIMAAQSTQQVRWGLLLAIVTAAALFALAVWQRNLPLLGIGALGVFLSVPATMQRIFPGSVGAAIGLLIAGALMMLCAVVVLRHGRAVAGGAR
jgi:hypothetical protein